MDPLRAHTWAEAHLYLMVTPCPACSRGPWEILSEPDRPDRRTLLVRCLACGARKEFTFECPPPVEAQPVPEEAQDAPLERINPSVEPSRIIDVGQWLGLFYHLIEKADKAPAPAATRRLTFQAAQCLEEALKFYAPDEELPGNSGFFTQASRDAFAKAPEKFARQRLRDLRSKLPEMRVMLRRLTRDGRGPGRKPWWQFWRR
jgi:hypothetical protein